MTQYCISKSLCHLPLVILSPSVLTFSSALVKTHFPVFVVAVVALLLLISHILWFPFQARALVLTYAIPSTL